MKTEYIQLRFLYKSNMRVSAAETIEKKARIKQLLSFHIIVQKNL